MPWLARNDHVNSDKLYASDLNSLANDIRAWGDDVNGGGHHLYNVILAGGGSIISTASPLVITQGSDAQTLLSLTAPNPTAGQPPLNRWQLLKNPTAESGSNSGSDFALARYDDAGNILGYPLQIRRSDGLMTLGQQQWSGPVNGGGYTLSNVQFGSGITGMVTSAFGRSGAVTAAGGDYAAFYPPLTRQIIAGAGLAGGGDLTADRTLSAVPLGASGATHAAGICPDPGATPGSARYLCEDATWRMPPGSNFPDPTTTLGDMIVRGSSAPATRLGVGSNGQVVTADSTQPLGVKWAVLPPMGASGTLHASGLTPDTPPTAGSTKFLREDAVWAVPTGTGGGAGPNWAYDEVPAGTMDGTNTTFTLTYTPNPSASVDLFLNGVEQRLTVDYTVSGNTIHYTVAPDPADTMRCDYTY